MGSNVLPNLNGRVLQGAETAGEYKEAGLPNITGNVYSAWVAAFDEADGCFGTVYLNGYPAQWQSEYKKSNNRCFLDASRCSSIYGASTTVQPPAYTVKFYICWG